MTAIELIRDHIDQDVFDYQTLMHLLSNYASPRDVVTRLLKSKKIIRAKQGLYIFSQTYRKEPLELAVLANMIYGPSMISLEYALAYHTLIPERVEELTSVTTGRPHQSKTPVGRFTYRPTPTLYPGIQQVKRANQSFLIATPERALADKIRDDRHGGSIRTLNDMHHYLFDNLRIDQQGFMQMNLMDMQEIAEALHSEKIRCCASLLRKMKRQSL